MRVAIVGEPARSERRSPHGFGRPASRSSSGRGIPSAAAAALELDCVGEANGDACAGADFVIVAVNAEATLATARELRENIATTPVLSVASELRFSKDGVFPTEDAGLLAERIQAELDAPVSRASTRSPRGLAGTSRPTRTHSCAETTPRRRRWHSSSPTRVRGRARCGAARARAPEGLTAVMLNVNKRYKGHAGIQVTGLGERELRVIPLRGIPELEEGDDLASLLVRVGASGAAVSLTASSSSLRRRSRRSKAASSISPRSSRPSGPASSPATPIRAASR